MNKTPTEKTSSDALWDDADTLFENDTVSTVRQETRVELNKQKAPILDKNALKKDTKEEIAPNNNVQESSKNENSFTESPPSSDKKNIDKNDQSKNKNRPKAKPTPLIPCLENGYAKPVKYRSSIKAFYPHFALSAFCALVALFPSIALSIFKEKDLAEMPEWLATNLPLIIRVMSAVFAVALLGMIVKLKSTGVIKVYADYLTYKKGIGKGTTIHYADIRTKEVHRCLATLYAPVGDLHVISADTHIVMPNLLNPFDLQDALLKRKSTLLGEKHR